MKSVDNFRPGKQLTREYINSLAEAIKELQSHIILSVQHPIVLHNHTLSGVPQVYEMYVVDSPEWSEEEEDDLLPVALRPGESEASKIQFLLASEHYPYGFSGTPYWRGLVPSVEVGQRLFIIGSRAFPPFEADPI